MSAYIAKAVRQAVMEWASYRCCYCQTGQRVSGAQMHIEHIIPLAKGGTSAVENLCLSCAWCNSFKGANTHALDPEDQQWVSLFNPRQQLWAAHFQWCEEGVYIGGVTPVGRATVALLQMNNAFIVPARRLWVLAGWHPPGRL